jgi:hypothetical protein
MTFVNEGFSDRQTAMDQVKIVYIDHFSSSNSNLFWKSAFEKNANTVSMEIQGSQPQMIWNCATRNRPDHIHLGGSVKYDSVPVDLLSALRRELHCSVSHFYGDASPSEYHLRTGHVASIYVSNQTHVDWALSLGNRHASYMPCPTNPDIFHPIQTEKIYDVVFIGNNYSPTRLELLREVSRHFNLRVYGDKWEESGVPYAPPVFAGDFSRALSEAKIVLSLISDEFVHLKRYYSNRLMNSLACGACVMQTRTPDIEAVFENKKHILLYSNKDELLAVLQEFLPQEERCQTIADTARARVMDHYTYDKAVQRIIHENIPSRQPQPGLLPFSGKAPLHIQHDSNPPMKDFVQIQEMPQRRLVWADEAGPLPSNSIARFSFQENTIPTDRFARSSYFMELYRCLRPDGQIAFWGNNQEQENMRNQLSPFAFQAVRSDPQKIVFQKKKPTLDESDQFWMRKIQEGYIPSKPYSCLWYFEHAIAKTWISSLSLTGHVLSLFCGTGQFTFAAWIQTGASFIGVEPSFAASQYAHFTFGNPQLRFLPLDSLSAIEETPVFDHAIWFDWTHRHGDYARIKQLVTTLTKPEGTLSIALPEPQFEILSAQWDLQPLMSESRAIQIEQQDGYAFLQIAIHELTNP